MKVTWALQIWFFLQTIQMQSLWFSSPGVWPRHPFFIFWTSAYSSTGLVSCDTHNSVFSELRYLPLFFLCSLPLSFLTDTNFCAVSIHNCLCQPQHTIHLSWVKATTPDQRSATSCQWNEAAQAKGRLVEGPIPHHCCFSLLPSCTAAWAKCLATVQVESFTAKYCQSHCSAKWIQWSSRAGCQSLL